MHVIEVSSKQARPPIYDRSSRIVESFHGFEDRHPLRTGGKKLAYSSSIYGVRVGTAQETPTFDLETGSPDLTSPMIDLQSRPADLTSPMIDL